MTDAMKPEPISHQLPENGAAPEAYPACELAESSDMLKQIQQTALELDEEVKGTKVLTADMLQGIKRSCDNIKTDKYPILSEGATEDERRKPATESRARPRPRRA